MLDKKSSRIVAEKYELDRMIGRGGMGSVWEATHLSLGTKVAIKFIERDGARSSDDHARFLNEARASAQIESRFVVRVFDHGISEDGQPYIVMELLRGETLERRLERTPRLTLSQTAKLVAQVGRAVAKAHELGIVHRDLKPENIFLCNSADDGGEIAKVVDFGVAKFKEPPLGAEATTQTGAMMGTPSYMSPEQARGLKDVDGRTDLWALAIIAYECVVGRLPFEGVGVGDLLVKICGTEAPVPSREAPGIPKAFDAWFAKATRNDPDKRFQSSLELVRALLEAAGEPSLLASGTVIVERRRQGDRRAPEKSPRITPREGFARTTASIRDAKVSVWTLLVAGVALMVGFMTVLRIARPPSAEPRANGAQRSDASLRASAVTARVGNRSDSTVDVAEPARHDATSETADGGRGELSEGDDLQRRRDTAAVAASTRRASGPAPRAASAQPGAPHRRGAAIIEELGY